mmetsp:Transcript_24640/g.43938  ORF Transcript_24640/g.43938 Transcript_24640/m.43938 type:complete len:145 (-) Transcript_24640:18-452(-)
MFSRPLAIRARGSLLDAWKSADCPGTGGSLGLGAPSSSRSYYKFAKPPSPNLDALRQLLTERLVPVHFFLRNNLTFTNFVWDKHFIGIMCSPKFEGKSHKEINAMVDDIADEVGMRGQVRIVCQPPSKWHMMKRRTRKRWDFDR